MAESTILKIEDLKTYFFSKSKQAFIRSVDGISLDVYRGETLGVVGESGSGKSITALSIMGLVTAEPGVITGKIGLKTNGLQKNLLQDLDEYVSIAGKNETICEIRKDNEGWNKNNERVMAKIRGKQISMIFQNPRSAMNPFISIGKQITESIVLNTATKDRKEARERALYWLEQVRIDSPRLRYRNFPASMSGGMCQRAMIAMALSSEPAILIADEPTTGLDATIQSKIVDLMAELKSLHGITTILISHDINVILRLSDRVAVMYGGTVMECGKARNILSTDNDEKHPYTIALLAAIPDEEHIRRKERLKAIEGDVLDTISIPRGCRFYERCDKVTVGIKEKCEQSEPDLKEISSGHKVRCWRYGY